jgi:hypothetical protein
MVEGTMERSSVIAEWGFVAPHDGNGDASGPFSSGGGSKRTEPQDEFLLNELGAPTVCSGAGVESHSLPSAIEIRARRRVGQDSGPGVSW